MTKTKTLVVLDVAGTVLDPGSCAVIDAMQHFFAERGCVLTEEMARRDLGLPKRQHLSGLKNYLLGDASLSADDWADWTSDLNDAVAARMDETPGWAWALHSLQQMSPDDAVGVAFTTNYHTPQADLIRARLNPLLCVDDAGGNGEPSPDMIQMHMDAFGVTDPRRVVKVGDTVANIQAAKAAGCWSVGVGEYLEPLIDAGANLVMRDLHNLSAAIRLLTGWIDW